MQADWSILGAVAWLPGAIACALAALWLHRHKDRFGTARVALIAALAATAGWAMFGTIAGPAAISTAISEPVRNMAWLFALYRLFAIDGRHATLSPIRPILVVVGFVAAMEGAALTILAGLTGTIALAGLSDGPLIILHLLVVIGGLVLVHNLYGGAGPQARLALQWPALALAVLWGFDLNYYVIAYLSGHDPDFLAAMRGITALSCGGLLAFGAHQASEELRFRPSHAVAFRSASLLIIAGYLTAMVVIAQWLAKAQGDLAGWLQFGFVTVAVMSALMMVPSRRLRGWLRVTLTKHLFQHRYDYRSEWLRFTHTMGQTATATATGTASLEVRAIQALADLAESPAGLLLTPGDGGDLVLAARWQWPTADVPAVALAGQSINSFESTQFVADLDALRAGDTEHPAAAAVPGWLLADPRAWAIVPLLHFDRLVAMVVLARPAYGRKLDWEDFDLMRVVGRQLASYLAEHSGQEALAETSRFDDFNRRIAFVMHDIKNLASQLSLLARNAEQHAENPEFRADMLVTLRNSTDKLNAMLARLSRYGPATVQTIASVRADEVVAAVVENFGAQHMVTLVEVEPCHVAADRDSLEQVLVHLVQNAVDAGGPDAPVFVRVAADRLQGIVEITDSGPGMSAEFIRSRLFRPFDSTKAGGFGIGAYEARELLRAMGGRLDVDSREGLGSRFTINLPLSEAAEIYRTFVKAGDAAGKKVA